MTASKPSKPCRHPKGRIFYGTSRDFKETEKGPMLWDMVWGGCRDCGELAYTKWLKKSSKASE